MLVPAVNYPLRSTPCIPGRTCFAWTTPDFQSRDMRRESGDFVYETNQIPDNQKTGIARLVDIGSPKLEALRFTTRKLSMKKLFRSWNIYLMDVVYGKPVG